MKIKFNLNKFAKLDNIDNYPLGLVYELNEIYDDYLRDSKGVDVDFPDFEFGNNAK